MYGQTNNYCPVTIVTGNRQSHKKQVEEWSKCVKLALTVNGSQDFKIVALYTNVTIT